MKETSHTIKPYVFLPFLIAIFLVIVFFATSKADYPSLLHNVRTNFPGLDIAQSNENTPETVTADEVKSMVDRWVAERAKEEAWVHIVSNVAMGQDSGVVLPDGRPMPLSYIQDDWFYLNEDGLVERGVFTIQDFDGTILQQSVFKNGIIVNLTFDMRQDNVLPYSLFADFGLVK
jgi:hypothetical protein